MNDLILIFTISFVVACLIFFALNKQARQSILDEKFKKQFPYKLIPSDIEQEKFNILIYKRSRNFMLVALVIIPVFIFLTGLIYSLFMAFLFIVIYYFICVFITMGVDSYQSHRKILLLEQLPVAIEILVRKLQIGSSMESAVQTVAHQTRKPVSQAFTMIGRNLALKEPLPKIIGRFSLKYPLSAYQLLLMVIKMQEKTGANPIQPLERVSQVASQHHYLFSKSDIALTQSRMALLVMLIAPLVLFAGIYYIKPDILMGFVNASVGKVLIICAGFGYLIALLIFNRILKLTIL